MKKSHAVLKTNCDGKGRKRLLHMSFNLLYFNTYYPVESLRKNSEVVNVWEFSW